MDNLPVRETGTVLREEIDFTGKKVLDIGCGSGALVADLVGEGVDAHGLEVSAEALEAAKARLEDGAARFHQAPAEQMPFENGAFDIAIYGYSLHHVPVKSQAEALRETARVLKPGAVLAVVEPRSFGSYFDLIRPIADETEVISAAQAAIGIVRGERIFDSQREVEFMEEIGHPDFADFRSCMLAVDPLRELALSGVENLLRDLFGKLGETREDGGRLFRMKTHLHLLQRVS